MREWEIVERTGRPLITRTGWAWVVYAPGNDYGTFTSMRGAFAWAAKNYPRATA